MTIYLVLLLILSCAQEVNGRVSYSLRLVSFSNPNGTSWRGLHYHGNRRLCDSNGTDTCDTYFKICIQRKGGCFINHDSKVFSNTNNITFGNEAMWTGTLSTWDPNLLALINPFDKDSKAPDDLIDILNVPLSIEPGLKQSCPVDQTIVMSNLTTLTMEFKVWCSQGYTGPGCTYHYTGSNPYVSCDNGQLNLLCTNQEPAIVRYTSYSPASSNSIHTFEGYIGTFLRQHVCDTVRLESTQYLWSHSRLGFTAKCGDKPVDPMVVQAALATEGYHNQGTLNIVPTPLNNYHSGMHVATMFAVKIQNYTNPDHSCKTNETSTRKCCDGGHLQHCDTDTCDTHFRICINNDPHNTQHGNCIDTVVRPDTNELSTCGDIRVNHTTNQLDVASTYISVTDTWTWNNTYIHVEVRDADDANKYDVIDVITLKQDLTPGHWDLSDATAVSVLLKGHVSLHMRLLVWCGVNKYGKNCDVQCSAKKHKSCDPDTGATICQSGYTGNDCHDIDECKESYCHEPGTSHCTNHVGSYHCSCNGGWSGQNCSQNIDECKTSNACHNGGTCTNSPGSFSCSCVNGWTGTVCDNDVNECENDPCLHGGTCHNTDGSYTCLCKGFSGQNCTHDVDECQNNPCLHGGTCNNTVGSYTCSCHGYSGQNCGDDINECKYIKCPNDHTHCVNTIGSYRCQCNKEWTGDQCNTDVNECQPHPHQPCQHGGTCHNINGNYTCHCVTGWTGLNCDQDVNECEIRPKVCRNNGTCTNKEGGYSCACMSGWTGDNCTSDVNECNHQVCKNNATCTNIDGDYKCHCTEGWQGHTCEEDIDECQRNPCHHEATCHNIAGSYICNVDIDECNLINACLHGLCENTNGSFMCKCRVGWSGPNCTDDIDECRTIGPCLNSGQCINTAGSFRCICTPQWVGHLCSQDVDECKLPNRCNGNDVCINYPGGFLCSNQTESTTSKDLISNSTFSSESYVSVIGLECSANAWTIRIYLPELYKRHVDFDPSDIYLGEAGCEGYRSGDYLIIYQQYSNCLTRHNITLGNDVYSNTLVYALRDVNYKFIIRAFRFRLDLECNMAKHETISQHFIETHSQVRMRSNNPRISGHGYYNVLMTFYRDSNFLHPMIGNSLLLADIGEDIYVKLTTHVTSTDVKMRLDSCYTLPSPGAGENFKFYIIRNACVTDINTRVLYTSPHETKFMFRDFEYSTDHDNLYLYCTTTFCNRTDHSSVCDQQCHHRALRSVLATTGGYLGRVTTSGAVRRRIGRGRAVVGEPDLTGLASHAQSKGIDGVIFIVSLGVVSLSVSIVLLVIQRRRKHKPRV